MSHRRNKRPNAPPAQAASTASQTPTGVLIDDANKPEESPARLVLMLWGIPFLIIVAAVAVKLVTKS